MKQEFLNYSSTSFLISKLFIAMISRFFAVVFGILLFTSCATTKIERQIGENLETSPTFRQGFAGFALYDPAKKEMLFSHNAEKYFTPASNTKLFTLYTGLKVLGDSIPALRYTEQNDTLFFTGTGDPSFLNPNLEESKVLSFLKDRDDTLVMVQPAYTDKQQGPGWSWDDYNSYYSAERTPFPLYGNLVEFGFTKGDEAPSISPRIFRDSLIVSTDTSKISRIQREVNSNIFSHHNFKRDKNYTQNVPFHYTPEVAAKLLSDTLKKPVHIQEKSPELDKKLYSLPADSIYKRMMEVSDNFIAEQILLMAGNELQDSLKSDIAIKYMKENHLKDLPDEPQWVDGSGLSRYNLFTPRTMVSLLEKIKNEVPEHRLLSMLATGGKSGTLKNFYKADEPYIFAKTGTLRNNHSLSGYLITKKGRLLIFSFMNSNYTVPTSELKQGMENILLKIRDNY